MKLKKLVIATALTASLTAQSAFGIGDAIRTVDGAIGSVLVTATVVLAVPVLIVASPFIGTGWTIKRKYYGKELLQAKGAANKYLTNFQLSMQEKTTLANAWDILGNEVVNEETQETTYSVIEKRCIENGAVSIQTCVQRNLSLIVSHLGEAN